MKRWWILSNSFSTSNKMIMWFSSLTLLIQWITLMNFCILNHPYIPASLHPWDEAYLVMIDELFDVFLVSFCKFFIKYFCIVIRKWNWSEVLFLCWIFLTLKPKSFWAWNSTS
jgi:hypothetical protein